MEPKKDACACDCQSTVKLIFPCSGASDVGEIADRAARQLTREGIGKMYCLAGIGGKVSGIIESTRSAATILAIDGCPVACAKKTLEREGFNNYQYIMVTQAGMEKGKSPATPERITVITEKGKQLLDGKKTGCCL
jgi:uncharacterized metal-binding protein